MYKDAKFSIENMAQIEKDLQEAKQIYGSVERVFLVNGDAFVLSANKLKTIANLIIKNFPMVKTITMYASINNIKSKSDAELKELAELRIGELWIGVETGHEATLRYMNKGFELKDSYEQLERLNTAGMSHIDIIMFGAAGKGKGIENAEATAKLMNHSKPIAVTNTTLGAFGNSQLAEDVKAGIFQVAEEFEVLQEQKRFIELIDVDTAYLGIHGINTVTFDAQLPRQKEQAIKLIDDTINKLDSEYLHSVPIRQAI
jgi:radical SAM superfamily enzyme YgiQ (UPF0313 family)